MLRIMKELSLIHIFVRAATSAMYCRLLFMVCSALGVCEAAMPHPKKMCIRDRPCEAGIQVKREQGTLAESLETANYKYIQ